MESIISKLYYSPCEKPAPNTERFKENPTQYVAQRKSCLNSFRNARNF